MMKKVVMMKAMSRISGLLFAWMVCLGFIGCVGEKFRRIYGLASDGVELPDSRGVTSNGVDERIFDYHEGKQRYW